MLDLARAADQAEDCKAMAAALQSVVDSHADAIDRLADASGEPNSGHLTFAEENLVEAFTGAAVRCRGVEGGAKLAAAVAPPQ